MPDNHPQYEYKSVQAIRGTETKTIAKWQNDGWELDTRGEGSLLRTEITFRRVKPKTLGAAAVAAFRRLEPTAQRLLLAGAGALVLLVVVGIGALTQGGGGPSGPTVSANEAAAVPSGQPSESSAQKLEAAEPEVVPAQSAAEEILTVENNEDLAALLALTDQHAAAVGEFAATYRGRTIEFDGNIAYMNLHGDNTTRYDILVGAGDYSETGSPGPNFQFRDVNIGIDLHLTGSNVPDTIGIGDNLHIVARVGDYNSTQGLFFLEPISTEVR